MENTHLFYIFLIIYAATMAIVLFVFRVKTHSHPCELKVVNSATGRIQRAIAYRRKANVLELKVFNAQRSRYEWKPLEQFDNPFLLAYCLDKEWAKAHWYSLLS